MYFTTSLLLNFVAGTVSAIQRCGTGPPTSDFLAVHAAHLQQSQAASNGSIIVARQTHSITIDVYAHVIVSQQTGNTPQDTIVRHVFFPGPLCAISSVYL